MAKKSEKSGLSYLQSPVPDVQGEYRNAANKPNRLDVSYLKLPVPDVQGEYRNAVNKPKHKPNGLDVSYLKLPVPDVQGEYRNAVNKPNGLDVSYLKLPVPGVQEESRLLKIQWLGLNKAQELDTGELSAESNISSDYFPYLSPSPKRAVFLSGYAEPVGMFGFEDILLVVYASGSNIYLDYIRGGNKYTGLLNNNGDKSQRSIVRFNVYDNPNDPVLGEYIPKLVIFPDKKTVDFNISANFTPAYITNMPDIKYAAVHLSRLFGVDDGRIYASGFNDYANWNLDTADEYSANNAWCSPAQSNVKAAGNFTGITVYDNHVICFKSDYIQELYNNKNPFRIMDIYNEGAIDNRCIADVDGWLIFVGEDGVKVYTGGNPKLLSYKLNTGLIHKAVAGTDKRKYYLYCKTSKKEHNLFVYDTQAGQFCEESIDCEIISFAHTSTGMYALTAKGEIMKIDSYDYRHEWFAETDLFLNRTINIKRVQKIQLLADVEEGSRLDITCFFDDKPEHIIYSEFNTSGQMKRVPIRIVPRLTANYRFKIRFSGYGMVKLYQLEVFIKEDGELYV